MTPNHEGTFATAAPRMCESPSFTSDSTKEKHLERTIDWDGEHDPENPVNWTKSRKWRVTGFSCAMCFACGINALSISSAASGINRDFGVSDATFPNSYWAVTAWNVGAAFFPLVLLPVLEDFGVRPGYLISYFLFTIFIIPQAVAQNYATLIATRFFAGGFSSVVQNGVENVIGDIWIGTENSIAVTVFIFAYLSGFTIGPVIGSAIVSVLNWRWIFYISLIVYAALLPLAYLLIPETRGDILLAAKARSTTKRTGELTHIPNQNEKSITRLLYDSTIRPAQLFFTEPVVFFFTIWCSLAVGNVFIATQSILQVYEANYAFTEVGVGYIQASMVVGEMIGFGFCIWQNRIYLSSASKNIQHPDTHIPEHRLQLSIPGSFIGLAGGLFVYGWTSYPSFPWIAPTIGLAMIGAGIMLVVQAAATYLTDSYGTYAGSAIAAVACVENLMSGLLPLSAQSMYTNLGFRWASSLLGIIAVVLSFAPVVLFLKGPEIRKRSKFMSNL